MENLPKAPAKDIQYGMLQPDCEKKYRDWIVALINEAIKILRKKLILPMRFMKKCFN